MRETTARWKYMGVEGKAMDACWTHPLWVAYRLFEKLHLQIPKTTGTKNNERWP
jgi:hypothetical protein